MKTFENLRQALGAVRSNWLRSSLTILIIAFGVMSMVGVLTSIDALKFWLRNSFSTLGANTFVIQNQASNIRIGGRKKRTVYSPITFDQALKFKSKITEEKLGLANIRGSGSFMGVGSFGNLKTNSNLQILGTDENFLVVESYDLVEGRTINEADVRENRKVCVIGHELRVKLFPSTSGLHKYILLNRQRYEVVGILGEKGSTRGSFGDKVALIPISTLLFDFPDSKRSFTVNVYVKDPKNILSTAEVSWSFFRIVRKLHPNEESNFAIILSDSFVADLMDSLKILTLSSTMISVITLFGASVALMNIMLVSVTERTMEIGLRKSLGATRKQIMLQFLTEAVTICQLGGILGILFGVGIGFGISKFLNANFVIPYAWMILGITVCFFVGIFSGLYPARKASKLDPIESLRYE